MEDVLDLLKRAISHAETPCSKPGWLAEHGEITDSLYDALPALAAEIERLRQIVSRLPVTADGVPITPGMEVWFRDEKYINSGTVKYARIKRSGKAMVQFAKPYPRHPYISGVSTSAMQADGCYSSSAALAGQEVKRD